MGVAEGSKAPSMLKLPPVVLRRWPLTPIESPSTEAERGENTSFISCQCNSNISSTIARTLDKAQSGACERQKLQTLQAL